MARPCPSWFAVSRRAALAAVALGAIALAACEPEKRAIGPSPPSTPPTGLGDLRQAAFASNRYEQSEGARMFRWHGCDSCHRETAAEPLRMADGRWRYGGTVAQLYRSIAEGRPGMPAYQGRIADRQIWQMAGYVSSRPRVREALRRRQADALQGEPSGATWSGPLP